MGQPVAGPEAALAVTYCPGECGLRVKQWRLCPDDAEEFGCGCPPPRGEPVGDEVIAVLAVDWFSCAARVFGC